MMLLLSLAVAAAEVGGAQGPGFRTLESDRIGYLQRECAGPVGRQLFQLRDALDARPAAGAVPNAPEAVPLITALGQTPSQLAAFWTGGTNLWSIGGAPAFPATLDKRAITLAWAGPQGGEVVAWLPSAAPRDERRPPDWYFARFDLGLLLRAHFPSNQLMGTEVLYAIRPDTGAPLASASSRGFAPLADPALLRTRPQLKQVLDRFRRDEEGLLFYPRFDTATTTRVVRSRVSWIARPLAGLPLVTVLETERPFLPDPRNSTGTWQREGEPDGEGFDLVQDGPAWQLKGRGAWDGLDLVGRLLENSFSTSRVLSERGLPGLNSFSMREPEPGILRADVYQRKDGAIHHFVYQFRRAGSARVDPDEDMPLKIQVR